MSSFYGSNHSRPRFHLTYQPSQSGDEPADHQMGLTAHFPTVQFAKAYHRIDTYSKSFQMTCHNLCPGLEMYLQQADIEPRLDGLTSEMW